MKEKVKLIMVENKPYVVNLGKPEIGDKVIVTVGGQYPSIVECENETVLNLLTDSKLSLTKAFKIFMEPEHIKFTPDQIEKILENDGLMDVEFDEGTYKYSL
jgi:ATP-dependent protease HslVU (ClpYQ) ATPase subunit